MGYNNNNYKTEEARPRPWVFYTKGLLIMVFLGGASQCAYAQGATIQAMLQQIAALEAYLKVAEKGYQIVEDGLHTIGDIKNGEFNLHTTFFASLQTVNPKVAAMAEVVEVATLQATAIRQFQLAISRYQSSGLMSSAESSYLATVYQNLIKIIGEDVTALTNLVTSNQLGMTDGERIRRIQVINERAKHQARYVQSTTVQTDLMVTERSGGQGDIKMLQSIYGLNQLP